MASNTTTEDAVTHHSESSKSSKNRGVVSLLEKYSSLHASIDETRQGTARCHRDIQQTQHRIHKLLQERNRIQGQTEVSHTEMEGLVVEQQAFQEEISRLKEEHCQALTRQMQARQDLECLQQGSKDCRSSFLTASQDFRTNCKRLCVKALNYHNPLFPKGSSDTEARLAPLMAYAHATSVNNSNTLPVSFRQNLEQITSERSPKHEDEEMQTALKLVHDWQEHQTKAREERDERYETEQTLQSKTQKQASQRKHLQAQLDRIMNDIDGMQEQLMALEGEDQESKQERGDRHKPTSHAPDQPHANGVRVSTKKPMPRNPYLRPKQSTPRASAPKSANDQATVASITRDTTTSSRFNTSLDQPNISATPTSTMSPTFPIASSLSKQRQQYPHRVGKAVRASTDFGAALRLGGMNDDASHAKSTIVSSTSSLAMHQSTRPHVSTKSSSLAAFSDDDDDDDVLSYVVFRKKK